MGYVENRLLLSLFSFYQASKYITITLLYVAENKLLSIDIDNRASYS